MDLPFWNPPSEEPLDAVLALAWRQIAPFNPREDGRTGYLRFPFANA
jgi:hypothetical protein